MIDHTQNRVYNTVITSIDGIRAFTLELHNNGHLWHFDDDPYECGFDKPLARILNDRVNELWTVSKANNHCPFEYALEVMGLTTDMD